MESLVTAAISSQKYVSLLQSFIVRCCVRSVPWVRVAGGQHRDRHRAPLMARIIARPAPPRHEIDWLSLHRIARKSATFFAMVSPAKSTVVTILPASVSMAMPPARCSTSRKLERSQASGSGSPARKSTLRKCSTHKSRSHTRDGPPTALPRW